MVVGYWMVLRRAGRYGVDSTRAGTVFAIVAIAGMAGGLAVGGGRTFSSSGVGAGCAVALLVCAWRMGSWALLDVFASALPLPLMIARVGCFMAHDHVGRHTESWLGVRFPGGTSFDLGLMYALGAALVVGVTEVLGRRPLPSGVLFGIVVSLIAITRLAVLRLGVAVGLADEVFAGVVFVLGFGLGVWRWRSDRWTRGVC